MKKLILLLTINAITNIAFSQDNIVLKNGDEINAKISEVGESNIKYKKFNNLDGPIYTKSKEEIFYIKYSNGEKEIFLDNVKNKSSNTNLNKKILISGRSIFNFSQYFGTNQSNFDGNTSTLNINTSVGAFVSRNFVLGADISVQNINNYTNTAIGPFIRGYYNNFYSHLGYSISKYINTLSVGLGYQLYLNKSESLSLNPTFIYFNDKFS